jgi:hypothetical protein
MRLTANPLAAVIAGAGLLLLTDSAIAAMKSKPQAAALVQQALTAEVNGDGASRGEQLARAIESSPDYARARWAAGYVEQEGTWLKFDTATGGNRDQEKLAVYRQMREDAADTAEGHLKLANWCHQQGLKDEEQAHLQRVLDFEPNRTDVRERLGMKRVGGVWMMPREAQQAAVRGKQAVKDLNHWRPRVEKFRAALQGPAGRIRDLAAQHVREIRDPTAIVALETVLAPSCDEAGAAVVDALAALKRPDASIALARIATFSESSETIDAARAKLKTLPLEQFVPAMLASLSIPEAARTVIASDRYGRLIFQQAFSYEGADRKRLFVFDNIYSTYSIYGFRDRQSGAALAAESVSGSVISAARLMAADAQNHTISRTNAHIIETLRDVTGEPLSADPRAWWQWWNELNEIVPVGDKPTDVNYVVEETTLLSSTRPHCACLIAGTPIWTDRGPIAVEKMHVGDRVLAQDDASGELAYKPVLRTTVRPRSALLHISLPDETIVASGGHPFWIAGRGWVNARHLEPGMLVHTVTGTVPVKRVDIEEQGQQPVYNLVVEDFHDYFAGNSHVLLHDITPREPTLGPVPGWQESRLTNQAEEK